MYHDSQTFGCEVEMIISYLSARYQLVLWIFNMHSTCVTSKHATLNFYKSEKYNIQLHVLLEPVNVTMTLRY